MYSSTPTSNASTVQALVHRKSLIGFRAACEDMWGPKGYRAIVEKLPADVRARTAGMLPLPIWIRLDDLIAWHVVVWNGPAKRDEVIMKQHIQRTIDQGFGKVKRLLLSMATPHTLAPRVVSLWSEEYSTGSLTTSDLEAKSITLILRDHGYVKNSLMRFVITEVYRYVVSLTKVKNVTAVHTVRDEALNVILRWE